MPSHIDQNALPKGIYWHAKGKGRWRMRVMKEGRWVWETVAGPNSALSDLHRIVEEGKGGPNVGTVEWMLTRFHDSSEFKALGKDTKRDYEICRNIINDAPTKIGIKFGGMQAARLTTTNWQAFHENIVRQGHPSKANHALRYARRVYSWANPHLGIRNNPVRGVIAAKERKRHKMPQSAAFTAVVAFARERGKRKPHTEGSVPPYLAPLLGLAYAMRLRRIEVVFLTDAHGADAGILANRAKGSSDNITKWTPGLRTLWAEALAIRAEILERKRNKDRPIQIRPEDRPIFISEDATPLTRDAVSTAVKRLMKLAIKCEVIEPEQAFTLHGIKHRAITDSKNKGAAGHKTEAMRRHYDHELEVVEPTGEEGNIAHLICTPKEKGT